MSDPKSSRPLSDKGCTPLFPLVCILILNWNRCEETLECLESVAALSYLHLHTIVIDNGSHDRSVAEIERRFPQTELIKNRSNLGYAAGNNAGISRGIEIGAEYFLVLNNDVRLAPDAVDWAVSAATSLGSAAGVIGMAIYEAAVPDKIYCFGADEQQRFITEEVRESGESRIFPVHSVAGCAMLLSKKLVQTIGGFYPDFFLMYEETDLCARAANKGFSVVCAYKARAWHKGSLSFGGRRSPLVVFYCRRNKALYLERRLAECGALKDLPIELQHYFADAKAATRSHLQGLRFRSAFAELAAARCALARRWGKKSISFRTWLYTFLYLSCITTPALLTKAVEYASRLAGRTFHFLSTEFR